MSRFSALVVLAMLASLVGCGGGPRAQWELAVTSAELAEVGLDYLWQNKVPLDGNEQVTRIWHLDENVYCLTSINRVLVFNALTGEFRWSESLGHSNQTVFAPSHADRAPLPEALRPKAAAEQETASGAFDLVIFNTVTYALVFHRSSGELLERLDFAQAKFAANTPTVCDGDRV